jgi:hypothetical protein
MFTTLALTLTLHAAPAQLIVELQPPETMLIVDGKKKGLATKPFVLKLSPGRHLLRVEYKGDAHEEEIAVKAGEKKTWKWEFDVPAPPRPKEPAEEDPPVEPPSKP